MVRRDLFSKSVIRPRLIRRRLFFLDLSQRWTHRTYSPLQWFTGRYLVCRLLQLNVHKRLETENILTLRVEAEITSFFYRITPFGQVFERAQHLEANKTGDSRYPEPKWISWQPWRTSYSRFSCWSQEHIGLSQSDVWRSTQCPVGSQEDKQNLNHSWYSCDRQTLSYRRSIRNSRWWFEWSAVPKRRHMRLRRSFIGSAQGPREDDCRKAFRLNKQSEGIREI